MNQKVKLKVQKDLSMKNFFRLYLFIYNMSSKIFFSSEKYNHFKGIKLNLLLQIYIFLIW